MPRDAASVTFVRHMLDQALETLGATDQSRHDACLILTEACANAVDHAREVDEYEVGVQVDAHQCVAEVVNTGVDVDLTRLTAIPPADALRERGRGLQLIAALADEVEFAAGDDGGLAVRATLTLRWRSQAPALAIRSPDSPTSDT